MNLHILSGFLAAILLMGNNGSAQSNNIDAVTCASSNNKGDFQVIGGKADAGKADIIFWSKNNIGSAGDYYKSDLKWGKTTACSDGTKSMAPYLKATEQTYTITGLSASTTYYYFIDLDHKDGWARCNGSFKTYGETPITLSSITVAPDNTSIAIGATRQLKATGEYSDGSSKDISTTAAWSSSATETATVSSSGLVNGVKAGTVAISAKLDSITGTAAMKVNAASVTLASITLIPANASVYVGKTQQFKATGKYSDTSTSNISADVTWASSDEKVATVSTSGLAEGIAPGKANITASMDGVNSQASLAVKTPVTLTGIALKPDSAELEIGGEQTFAALAKYSDASSKDISCEVIWQVLSQDIASIDSGLVSALAPGNTLVVASLGGIFQSAKVMVKAAAAVPLSGLGQNWMAAGETVQLSFKEPGSYSLSVTGLDGKIRSAMLLKDASEYVLNSDKLLGGSGATGIYFLTVKNAKNGRELFRKKWVLF